MASELLLKGQDWRLACRSSRQQCWQRQLDYYATPMRIKFPGPGGPFQRALVLISSGHNHQFRVINPPIMPAATTPGAKYSFFPFFTPVKGPSATSLQLTTGQFVEMGQQKLVPLSGHTSKLTLNYR